MSFLESFLVICKPDVNQGALQHPCSLQELNEQMYAMHMPVTSKQKNRFSKYFSVLSGILISIVTFHQFSSLRYCFTLQPKKVKN